MVTLSPVTSETDKRAFYNFAWRVYRDDPQWVPHLWPQRKEYLDRKAAFFTFGEGEFWLARRGRDVVGTIGTAIDHARNRYRNERAALFGFFEVLPDGYEVAAAMWDHACAWARARGMTQLRGPQSFGISDEPGFLVEGFEYAPPVLTGHTPPYYALFAERYGFRPELDSLAYRFDVEMVNFDLNNIPPAVLRIAARAVQRHGPGVVRQARIEKWDQEIERLHLLYNKSLAVLPETAPMPLAEFRAQAMALKPILYPDLALIAELDGQVVGFALGLPNIAEAFHKANGLRHPWDYLRLALAMRRIRSVSFKILVIDPAYWRHGLESVMFVELGKAILRRGYRWIDASLTAATNPQTNKLAAHFGAYIYRRYRQYWLAL